MITRKIKFFADTANLEEISYCFSRGVNDGITTNPKIMETTGDLSFGFENACKSILEKYPSLPVSLETDLRGADVKNLDSTNPKLIRDILLEQAFNLSRFGKNVVVKVPICKGGLLAAEELATNGIKTNITLCITPYQILEAAKVGKGYVSLFSNRMLDSHLLELSEHSLEEILTNKNWKDFVREARPKFLEQAWEKTLFQIAYVAEKLEGNPDVQLIVGSIRTPEDIYRIANAQPQIITIPTKIVEGLQNIQEIKTNKRSIKTKDVIIGDSLSHPMTQYTLEEFEKAADSYRNKKH